jgi:hypothetical protein
MRRESHRRRGWSRASAGGWGHRAVYVGAAVATASLLTGFAVAGFYFGTFSHVFASSGAQGSAPAPYGVYYLSEYASFASAIPYLNLTNSTAGPCQNITANGTNQLNASSVAPGVPLNLSAANTTNSDNATATFICLDSVFDGNISYAWDFVNGTYAPYANYTGWDNVSLAANNTTGLGNTTFNESLANLTGNANLSLSWINETGCNPVFNNTSITNMSNCAYFAGNNNTTFYPHGGFYNGTGAWVSLANATSPDPWYWHPNETGYEKNDMVYQATVAFANFTGANITYEIAVDFAGATPIPQFFFVNTGAGGANETITFLFDMSLAWTTALPGNDYGYNNTTDPGNGFFSAVIAEVQSVSIIVYQCYADATGLTVCPMTTAPILGSIFG